MNIEPRDKDNLAALEYLMQRAGDYRAVSARVALMAGVLALTVSGWMLKAQTDQPGRNIDARVFFEVWLFVFIVTGAAAGVALAHAAQLRSEPFISAGLKLALSSMTPSLFAGAAISACLTQTSGLPLFPAVFWLVFYGLALLSLRSFAWRGIILLGWAFLLSSIGVFIFLMNETIMPEFDLPTPTNLYPAAIMGATFGLYHVVYAACMWRRGETRDS